MNVAEDAIGFIREQFEKRSGRGIVISIVCQDGTFSTLISDVTVSELQSAIVAVTQSGNNAIREALAIQHACEKSGVKA